MGDQVRILDLAEDLIRLSGLEPGRDIEIVFTGIRAGEKLSESLWDEGMKYQPTEHPDVVRVDEDAALEGTLLQTTLDEIARLARDGDPQALIGLLNERVPGSVVGKAPPPDLISVL
jgi:FlaA1/EpsC-like NDP-sugar epimerase